MTYQANMQSIGFMLIWAGLALRVQSSEPFIKWAVPTRRTRLNIYSINRLTNVFYLFLAAFNNKKHSYFALWVVDVLFR